MFARGAVMRTAFGWLEPEMARPVAKKVRKMGTCDSSATRKVAGLPERDSPSSRDPNPIP